MPVVRVLLPRSLLQYWSGERAVEVDAPDVAAALEELGARFPGLRARVLDEQGRLREYVHLFVNEDAVSSDALDAPLRTGDVLHILPSVAGG